jgi:hypothetical protein
MASARIDDEFFSGRFAGCYNDADFRRIEATDPKGALEAYARYVTKRPLSSEYAEHVRRAIPVALEKLTTVASDREIQRNCVAVSMAMLQTLEQEGIWGFVLRGSVRFRFPLGSGIRDSFFWANDYAPVGQAAGHAWLVAPPFRVIDVTARYQAWSGREAQFLPKWIALEKVRERTYETELLAPPETRKGVRPSPSHTALWKSFSPFEVQVDGAQVFYLPMGVTVPEEQLSEGSLILGGRKVAQFMDQEIRPLLKPTP